MNIVNIVCEIFKELILKEVIGHSPWNADFTLHGCKIYLCVVPMRLSVEPDLGLEGLSPHSVGWSGPKSFLDDSEEGRGTHRRNTEGLREMCSLWDPER